MKARTKITMVFLLCLVLVSSASAKVLTAEVTGVVNSVRTEGGFALDSSISDGSVMTGFCVYDTDTPDMDDSPHHGTYPVISLSMTIGNYTFTHNPDSPDSALFEILSSADFYYYYKVQSSTSVFDGLIYLNGLPKNYEDIIWDDTHLEPIDVRGLGYVLPNDALPTVDTFPGISAFNWERSFEVFFRDSGDGYFFINGQVTSLTVVPGPFEVAPAKVGFHYYLGDPNPEPRILSIWAEGVDTLNWQITEDCNWLDVLPTSGQSSGEIDEVTLSVDISGLDIGLYSCLLTVFDPNVPDCICYLPVNLFVGSKLFVPSQYLTIQEAIDAANNYDIVLVADGTYTGPGNRDIDFLGKAITVRSENGPETCIIDCNGTEDDPHRGFYFHNGEDANSILDGFTITNGYANGGSGIYCGRSSPTVTNCTLTGNWAGYSGGGMINGICSSPTLTNCTLTGNWAGYRGGGMYNYKQSSPTVTNCTFSGNSAGDEGGGMWNSDNSPTLTNCTFVGNSAGDEGGGMWNSYSSTTVTNCIFSGNIAENRGGAIYCYNSSNATLTNCTITENSVPNGRALACDSRKQEYPSNVQMTNCVLWDGGNEIWNNDGSTIAISFTDLQGGQADCYDPCDAIQWYLGNIDADPCFIEPGYWVDVNDPNIITEPNDPNSVWVEGDYHLLPTSPCIDAGDNTAVPSGVTTDLDGNPRFVDDPCTPDTGNGTPPIVDMGAYEANYIEVAMKFTPPNLNCKSKGKFVKAHIALPEGFTPEDVALDTPALAYPMNIESEYLEVFLNDYGSVELEITFDRQSFCDSLTETGQAEVTVIGSLTTGQYFYGSDTIRILAPRRSPRR